MQEQRPAGRRLRRFGVAFGMVFVLAAATTGCSTTRIPIVDETALVDVSNTAWTGSCTGIKMGTYAFTFGPSRAKDGQSEGDVLITTPDSAAAPATVRYHLSPGSSQNGNSGGTEFAIDLAPAWKGSILRDLRNLTLVFNVGESAGHKCNLLPAPNKSSDAVEASAVKPSVLAGPQGDN